MSGGQEVFRITRKIEIDTAHRVPDHQSKCFNLHGHRYVIEATMVGALFQEGEQKGMVMDFGFIKECMMSAIHNPCDHATVLWANDFSILNNVFNKNMEETSLEWRLNYNQPHELEGWKLLLIREVPTAENLAHYWYRRLTVHMVEWFAARYAIPNIPHLEEICVYETPNCRARYGKPYPGLGLQKPVVAAEGDTQDGEY